MKKHRSVFGLPERCVTVRSSLCHFLPAILQLFLPQNLTSEMNLIWAVCNNKFKYFPTLCDGEVHKSEERQAAILDGTIGLQMCAT